MTSLPLSLRSPAARALAAGELRRLRRPAGGMLRKVAAGDLLWIREPFRLKAKYNGMAPTAADRLGARFYFAADLDATRIREEKLGPERPARSLPKPCHRHHARVISVASSPLQSLTLAEARAEGFTSRGSWARAWDAAQKAFGKKELYWAQDPTVLVLDLEHAALPLPEMQVPL